MQTEVAIYARVSTVEQAEQGYSIDAQISTLKDYCKMHHKKVYDVYVDRGISGKSIKGRLALQRLLDDAKEGLFNELLVWKINRLARKQIDLLKIVETLSSHGVTFRSYSENFETETPMGKFALQMMGAVSELERNTIVDNVKMGMKQRARQGKWNGGIVLGYESAKVPANNKRGYDTKLKIVPEEAVIIRKIFNLYASGKGFKAIANQLNKEGYRTKKDNLFGSAAIRKIIKNPIYIGKIRFNKQRNWSEKRRAGSNPNPIIAEGEHEAIISQELWDKVHTLYEKRRKQSKKKHNITFLLSGLLRCPECGASMVMNRSTYRLKDGTVKRQHYYVCGQHRSKGKEACHANSIKKEEAEEYVFKRIGEVLADDGIIKDLVDRINNKRNSRIKPLEEELKQLETRIEQANEKKEKYFKLYEEGIIDSSIVADKMNEVTEELKKLDSRKLEIEAELEEDSSAPVTFEMVKGMLSNFKKLIDNASDEQVKNLLRLVIKEITINEDREIESIKLTFDENVKEHFLDTEKENTVANEGSSDEDPSTRFSVAI